MYDGMILCDIGVTTAFLWKSLLGVSIYNDLTMWILKLSWGSAALAILKCTYIWHLKIPPENNNKWLKSLLEDI